MPEPREHKTALRTEALLQQLEKIDAQAHLPLERRLIETAVWFHRNQPRIPDQDLKRRLDFTEKSLDILLEILGMTIERIQELEGRSASSSLWLPRQ